MDVTMFDDRLRSRSEKDMLTVLGNGKPSVDGQLGQSVVSCERYAVPGDTKTADLGLLAR